MTCNVLGLQKCEALLHEANAVRNAIRGHDPTFVNTVQALVCLEPMLRHNGVYDLRMINDRRYVANKYFEPDRTVVRCPSCGNLVEFTPS
jgi:hypothetical protein